MSVFVINDKLALAAYLLNVYLYIGCVMNEWRLLYNLKNVFFYFIQLFWKYNIYHFSFILMSYFHIRSMFISLYSTKALYKKKLVRFHKHTFPTESSSPSTFANKTCSIFNVTSVVFTIDGTIHVTISAINARFNTT